VPNLGYSYLSDCNRLAIKILIMELRRKQPLIKVTSHGVETARYNSLLSKDFGGRECAVYANGNRLVAFDIESQETLIDQKVVNEAIMVICEC